MSEFEPGKRKVNKALDNRANSLKLRPQKKRPYNKLTAFFTAEKMTEEALYEQERQFRSIEAYRTGRVRNN
jgi:hypothetical protein